MKRKQNKWFIRVLSMLLSVLLAIPAVSVYAQSISSSSNSVIDISPVLSDYSFEARYIDSAGNPVADSAVITFEKIGKFSREDIPLPQGYTLLIPAQTDEEWMYPTALKFVGGEWNVTNPVVEIMVEKIPSNETNSEKKTLAQPKVKLKAKKGRKITVSWQKIKDSSGYVVYTSKKKTGFKVAKTLKKQDAVQAVIKAGKNVERIYVRVRPYYTEKGEKVYGPYSKIVSVKVRKF